MSASIVEFSILFFRNYFQAIFEQENKLKDAAFHMFPKQDLQCEINY